MLGVPGTPKSDRVPCNQTDTTPAKAHLIPSYNLWGPMMELSKLLILVLISLFPSRVKAKIPTSMGKDECTSETQKDVTNVSSAGMCQSQDAWVGTGGDLGEHACRQPTCAYPTLHGTHV